ncbi:MAG: DUF721 domain-containing protein [Candidatus Brocadiales bacterium]
MRKGRARPIGEILEEVIPRVKPQGGRTHQRLWTAWREVVGEEKAEHTRITLLRRGKLHIEVESPALLQELTGMNKADITSAMQEKLAGVFVDDIKLKLVRD